jgi:hypothetical protein
MHECDVVLLKKALPGTAAPVSCEGTILHVNDADAQAYIVEFFDENDRTIDVCEVVGDKYLELKWWYGDTK